VTAGNHRPAGSGDGRLASAAAPGSAPAREGAAPAEHRRLERHGDSDAVRDPWGRPLDDTVVLVLNDWTYAGRGYAPRSLGAQLALASADRARAR
jgi:hypothetical protein